MEQNGAIDSVDVCGKQFTHYTTFARNDLEDIHATILVECPALWASGSEPADLE